MKILILKPSSLGDVVQALPVLRLLRKRWPEAEIHWWIAAGLSGLLEEDPDVSRVVRFRRDQWRSPGGLLDQFRMIQGLRRERYDLVLDLQGLARSGVHAWLADASLTIGIGDNREGARGFYDVAVDRPGWQSHAVEWYFRVAAEAGLPVRERFDWLPVRPRAAAAIRSRWPLEDGPWVLICPGARWLNKRWPVAHFKELVSTLARQHAGLRFGIIGGPEDMPLGAVISEACRERVWNLAGQTSMPELIEWIRSSEGLVTNDTGPMHIAAAMGRPVVALFGPTNPLQTGPYGQMDAAIQRSELRCVPCMSSRCSHKPELECLNRIEPMLVAERARRAFNLV